MARTLYREQKPLLERVSAQRIADKDWMKHIAITNNRIYRLDNMSDITEQKTLTIEGYAYNLRRIAFYVIHKRWPKRGFKLPWE